MVRLGVNIDHVATIRQARKGIEPDPVAAAVIAELNGADGITVHLREDRRHIGDRDVDTLRRVVRTRLNLEMSVNAEIVGIACKVKPDQATLVPERREEITTEGGLDVIAHRVRIKEVVTDLREAGIITSLFIEPVGEQIRAARDAGAVLVEFHTGRYAGADTDEARQRELDVLVRGAELARRTGLRVNAGHGLNYDNTFELLKRMTGIEELNIGHSIISRAVLTGMAEAVSRMKTIIETAVN